MQPPSVQDKQTVVRLTLGKAAIVQYSYNSRGRPVWVVNADAQGERYSRYAITSYAHLLQAQTIAQNVPSCPSLNATNGYSYSGDDSQPYDDQTNPYTGRLLKEFLHGSADYLDQYFCYDKAGNPLVLRGDLADFTNQAMQTGGWSFTPANQWQQFLANQPRYVYGANGNSTTYPSAAGAAGLTYDVNNNLTSYTNSQTTMSAGYYIDGKRAWKTAGGVTTYYYYEGDVLLAEFDSAGQLAAFNTWGPTGLLVRNSQLDSSQPQETWYTYDILGNVAQRLDDQGNVLSTDSYDAYGHLLAGGDDTDPYGYKGQYGYYTDHETGLILCTDRYYDPELGRWLTEDPSGYDGGLNLYAYCDGDPVNGVDPSGNMLADLHCKDLDPVDYYVNNLINDLENGKYVNVKPINFILKIRYDAILKLPIIRNIINKNKNSFRAIFGNAIARNSAITHTFFDFARYRVRNNPLLVLGWDHAEQLYNDWISGSGEAYRVYGPNIIETQQMLASQGVTKAILQACSSNKDSDITGWGTTESIGEAYIDGYRNATTFQVGAYIVKWKKIKSKGIIHFCIENNLTVNSFYFHFGYKEIPANSKLPERTIIQKFWWNMPY